jgi:predicted  nucleic acid-binding Zn-ribbon protein
VSGCDDRSPAEKALVQSSRETHTVSGGSGPGDAGFETKKRQAAATALTSVEGSSPAEVAAMMSTLAQTQLGQSTGAKAELVNVEREAMLKESLVRGLLGEWASRASLASSLESFDASDAIKDLDASIVTKQKEAIDFGARKKELDAKIADLKAKADAANAQGAAAEAEYAKLRDQAQSLSAVQAEPLIAQAATFKRTSDEAHIQAARYLAEADVMSPESAEAAQAVERTANQIKGLEEARKHLWDRMAQSKSDGQTARAEADQVAENLDRAVQDYKAYRSGRDGHGVRGAGQGVFDRGGHRQEGDRGQGWRLEDRAGRGAAGAGRPSLEPGQGGAEIRAAHGPPRQRDARTGEEIGLRG